MLQWKDEEKLGVMIMTAKPTYRVVSNPVTVTPGDLTVLFAGESQTRPSHRVGPKV